MPSKSGNDRGCGRLLSQRRTEAIALRAFSRAASIASLVVLGWGASFDAQTGGTNPGRVEILRASGGLPPQICNEFREPLAIQQASSGAYYVFDRRSHAVYRVDADMKGAPQKIVEIGSEGGRLLEPTAFDLGADGTFAVADAPNGRERIQVFDATGKWVTGFMLPGRAQTRVSIGGLALGGVSTLAFLGRSVVINQPEAGALITEYGLAGTPIRSIGVCARAGKARKPQDKITNRRERQNARSLRGVLVTRTAGQRSMASRVDTRDLKLSLTVRRHIRLFMTTPHSFPNLWSVSSKAKLPRPAGLSPLA